MGGLEITKVDRWPDGVECGENRAIVTSAFEMIEELSDPRGVFGEAVN